MKQTTTTTFEWFEEVPTEHAEALQEHAQERIAEMTKEGFTSGELNTEVDGAEYSGWWDAR